MESEKLIESIQEPIDTAPEAVKIIMQKVLKLEKEKLYLKAPRNINDDILKIIKEAVQ
jgi:hypothetical protein